MGAWSESKTLTGHCWEALKSQPGLTAYPVVAGVAALVGAAVLGLPGLWLLSQDEPVAGIPLIAVGIYLATLLGFWVTGGLVAAADAALRGERLTFGQGMAASTRHLGSIAGWALIQTLVGWLLSAIRGGGDSNGLLSIVRLVLASTLAAIWALLTFLVMPVIVLEGAGPVQALKRSAHLFRQRWGEQLSGNIRIGVSVALFGVLPGVVLVLGGGFLAAAGDGAAATGGGISAVVVGAAVLIVALVLLNAIRAVFGVALYRYATTGAGVGPFSADELAGSIRPAKGGGLRTRSAG